MEPSITRWKRLAGGASCILALLACSDDPTCGVAGGTQACLCPTGQMGAQTCEPGGSWGTCQCEDPGPVDVGVAQDPGPEAPDTSPDAGSEVIDDGSEVPPDVADVPEEEEVAAEIAEPSDGGGEDAPDIGPVECNDDAICDPGEPVTCPGCGAIDVAAGAHHTCLVREDGAVLCWGFNMTGELGLGLEVFNEPTPVLVGLGDAVRIDAGGSMVHGGSTCVVLTGGTVSCWGLVNGSDVPAPVEGLAMIGDVATTDQHACAVSEPHDEATEVWCWGANEFGQVGSDPIDLTIPLPVMVPGLTAASGISTGASGTPDCVGPCTGGHSCAVQGGTAWCWGSGGNGQLGDGSGAASYVPVPADLTQVEQVSAGGEPVGGDKGHTCAVADGVAYCWGTNWAGQLGNGDDQATTTPVPVSNLTGVAEVGAGGVHSCARLDDLTVWCWGHNGHGQLGDGTYVSKDEPVQVKGLTDAVALSVGVYHACVLREDRTVRCWGDGGSGQLGVGIGDDSPTPIAPVGF